MGVPTKVPPCWLGALCRIIPNASTLEIAHANRTASITCHRADAILDILLVFFFDHKTTSLFSYFTMFEILSRLQNEDGEFTINTAQRQNVTEIDTAAALIESRCLFLDPTKS
eukprot:scaffold188613_cov35-Attheya_sp.AAC.1